jgi:hypothetical protein
MMAWNSFIRRIRYIVRRCICYDLAIQEGLNPLDRKIRRQMNAKNKRGFEDRSRRMREFILKRIKEKQLQEFNFLPDWWDANRFYF